MNARTSLFDTPARSLLAGLALVFVTLGSAASAGASQQKQTADGSQSADTSGVRVTRATNYLGTEVTSKDGHKVGDIADFYFDPTATPSVKYVIVVSGGFLGVGGDARAVPTEAIRIEGDAAKLDLGRDEFWGVAVLPQDRDRFLRDESNVTRLRESFNLSGESGSSASASNEDRLVSFSQLRQADLDDQGGESFGRIEDTWMSRDLTRAPYFEVSVPAGSPFAIEPRRRYAIPMQALELPTAERDTYRLSISEQEIRNAGFASEAQGVEVLRSGVAGRQVLRVEVPSAAE